MKPLLLAVLSTLSVILGLVGLGVVVWGLLRVRRTARTRTWPSTQGTVRSSTVVSRKAAPLRTETSYADDTPPEPQVLYRPQVEYTYTVAQKTYTGTALGVDEVEVSSQQHAQAHAARYVPGAPVTVTYDPEDPGKALLEPGIQAVSWAVPAAGAICLAVTGALYLFIRWYSGR